MLFFIMLGNGSPPHSQGKLCKNRRSHAQK